MLVWGAFDVPFSLQGIQAVNGRFVGGDLAVGLDLSDERGLTVFADIAGDILKHRLLLWGEGVLGQGWLRTRGTD